MVPVHSYAAEDNAAQPGAKVSYYREVRPILQANCQGCHQPAKVKGGYVMTDFKRLLAGGDSEGAAIVAGHPCPLAGRVSMDLIAIDVTDLPDGEAKRGDLVALLNEDIGVDDLASHAGTISYEVLVNLGRRFPRVYTGA